MSASIAALRRFAGPRGAAAPTCGLCAAPIAEPHEHLIEPATRRIECACLACALLFDHDAETRMRRVRSRVRVLSPIADTSWSLLGLPVELAFVSARSAPTREWVATLPSALGAVEHPIRDDVWARFADETRAPALAPDVEALLLDRASGTVAVLPIDRCFALVGRMRERWVGLGGGPGARAAVDAWLAELVADPRGAPRG